MHEQVLDIGQCIKRVQVRHHREIDDTLRPLGITLVQWDALRHLHEHPDASLHDLALLTFQSDQAFGTLAARMIDRGLMVRSHGRGRIICHALTPKGNQLLDAGAQCVVNVLDRSLAGLTADEQATFQDYLHKMLDTPIDVI